MFTWLFGDRGIPASYRHMDGFGSHTFQWVNAAGEQFFVKYHFKTDQGIECLSAPRRRRSSPARTPTIASDRLARGYHRGEFPSWTAQGADHAGRRGEELSLQPLRCDQGLAPRRLSHCIEVGKLRSIATRPTTSPTSSNRLQPGQFRARDRTIARQDAAGPPVRLRRRPALPAGRSTTPSSGQRPHAAKRGQLRP
jgi:hypothetical protein